MNLRELLAWGVVHKVHRPGERRELFRAETDVWTLFRQILSERKRRELDPSLSVLDRTSGSPAKFPTSPNSRSESTRCDTSFGSSTRWPSACCRYPPTTWSRQISRLRRSTGTLSRRDMDHVLQFV